MFDKATLFSQRGQFCDCGCGQFAHDAHHFAVPNLKRFSEWVNDGRNIVLVNHDEHISRKFDNAEWRRKFWARNVLRYGEKSMLEWLNAAPKKLDKHRLDFIGACSSTR
jgi:hypothetical protein